MDVQAKIVVRRKAYRLDVSILLLSLVLFVPAPDSFSHESIGTVSNTIVRVSGRTVDLFISIPNKINTILESSDGGNLDFINEYIHDRLDVATSNAMCQLTGTELPELQASGNMISRLTYTCPKEVKDITIASSLFYDMDETHIQLLKLTSEDNPRTPMREATLTTDKRVFYAEDVNIVEHLLLNRIFDFAKMGAEHIFSGLDHILFLICIIIAARGFMEILKIVTSFTVAHSVTLAMAWLGIVSIDPKIVEPLIALTIIFVALENIFTKNHGKRWLLVFFFGLIHGLGFAEALKGIVVSKGEHFISLLSFNAGIEAGQVLIIGILLIIRNYFNNYQWPPSFIRWSSVGMSLVGLIWFFERVLFNV